MKRVLKTVGILFVCGMLCIPQVDARGRNNNNGGNTTHKPASNPPSSLTGNHGSRPGNQGGKPGGSRPSNNRPNSNNNRPSNGNKNNGYRPGGGKPNANNGRPWTPPPPHHGHGSGNDWHCHTPRPNLPPPCPYHRPTPPPSFHYHGGWPVFNTILGVTIGTTLNVSINALISNGYNVTSYGNDMVCLTNVSMLNLIWPDATLYYSHGGLVGSQFIYSTPGYNMSRYNLVYTDLIRTYGSPVSIENLSNGITTTWFGSGSQYIQLSYQSQYAVNGGIRYYTTLAFGN